MCKKIYIRQIDESNTDKGYNIISKKLAKTTTGETMKLRPKYNINNVKKQRSN